MIAFSIVLLLLLKLVLFTVCPYGYYGINCLQKCKCSEAYGCNAVNGTCQCPPGKYGPSCNRRKRLHKCIKTQVTIGKNIQKLAYTFYSVKNTFKENS